MALKKRRRRKDVEGKFSILTHKQRVIQSIKRDKLDKLPTQLTFTPEMSRIVARHLSVSGNELERKLDNHIIALPPDDTVRIDQKEGIRYDHWAIGWDIELSEGFLIRARPLEKSPTLKGYNFPNPKEPYLLNSLKETVEKYRDEYFILLDQGWTLFERAHCLRGFENLLMDFTLNKKFVGKLLDKITEYVISMAEEAIKLGVDGGYTGDDFGGQDGVLFSTKLWRKLFKPRYKEIWGVFKKANLPVFHHSCGDVRVIIPNMLEIGLDVLNPVQPQAMPIEELAKEYGRDLTFWGGISTQKTLPFGTKEEVEEEVLKCIKTLGRNNGYIVGPSHDMTSDIPLKNFDAFLNAVEKYNKIRS